MKKIIFVTGNRNKLEEAKQLLQGYDVENVSLDLPEIQGSAEEVVFAKAKAAYQKLQKPCFVEDVSFGFDAWKGLPGPYIKDFIKKIGVENLPSLIEGKSPLAKTVCMIGFARSEVDVEIIKGTANGRVVAAGGKNGFDYDKIFVPEGCEKRYSEMTLKEKNSISHRSKAYKAFRTFLELISF